MGLLHNSTDKFSVEAARLGDINGNNYAIRARWNVSKKLRK